MSRSEKRHQEKLFLSMGWNDGQKLNLRHAAKAVARLSVPLARTMDCATKNRAARLGLRGLNVQPE
jgi:hypothetical protein